MVLRDKKILLGVTGGIAAYKAAELCRLLVKAGADVQVAMSEGALRFITPTTFQALSGKAVFASLWNEDGKSDNAMAHIDLSREADLMVIAPASANFIARVAEGFASDLLSTLVLARDCPLLIAPAMNKQMWENPATRRNITQIKADGILCIGPEKGEQACGEVGYGRMTEPLDILEEVVCLLSEKTLLGKKVLITAGPTFEAIDAVRGITNLSSGRMGYAVAKAARNAGAVVTLVSGPVALQNPKDIERIAVQSADEMHHAVMQQVDRCDIFIAVAAVADYRVENKVSHKIKKEKGGISVLHLVENKDILAEVAARKPAPYCVGFAAESEHLKSYAESKRQRKKIPLIAANLIQENFGSDTGKLILFDDKGEHPLVSGSKDSLAAQLIWHIAKNL